MAITSKKDIRLGLPPKSYWHLYSLQNLASDKLARVVNKVLKNEYRLVK